MINCIIVDDEHLALVLLEGYIQQIPELKIVARCEDATQAWEALEKYEVDLMFLDIQMPDMTGVELLRKLEKRPMVIFTTAYAEYALEGYELDVVDYLLKPINLERFQQATTKAIDIINWKRKSGETENIKDHFFVKDGYQLVKVFYHEILFIEGLREYVGIHTPKRRIITLESMKNLEVSLPSERFTRTHKSYIIAIDKVESVSANSLEINGTTIPISKTYKKQVATFFK